MLHNFVNNFHSFLQYMSEKIGGAKGTELDVEFNEMERVCLLCFVFDIHNIYAIIKWILNLSAQMTIINIHDMI